MMFDENSKRVDDTDVRRHSTFPANQEMAGARSSFQWLGTVDNNTFGISILGSSRISFLNCSTVTS